MRRGRPNEIRGALSSVTCSSASNSYLVDFLQINMKIGHRFHRYFLVNAANFVVEQISSANVNRLANSNYLPIIGRDSIKAQKSTLFAMKSHMFWMLEHFARIEESCLVPRSESLTSDDKI